MTRMQSLGRKRGLRLALALAGLSVALGACTHTSEEVTGSVPNDYRLRHPIAVQEANQSIVVFAGTARGGLTASQRADVTALGSSWLREGTGAITIDAPANTPNSRAAAASVHEIRSLLAGMGIPPRGIIVHPYQPNDPRLFAAIRVSYPKISAVAGPCGLWPDDLGSSVHNKDYFDNKPYWNFGCATQRNLAAMVDNPSDLVQPRPETPAYAPRRAVAFDRYRKGMPTTTVYPQQDKAKLSDVGK